MSRSHHKTVVTVALLVMPFLVWLAIQAKTNTEDRNNWIDKTSTEYAEWKIFRERFGTGDEILISWDGCNCDDPRLELAANCVRRECRSNIDRVVTGSEALRRLRESTSRFSDKSSRQRLRGSLFGDDLKTTCLVVTLSQQGRANLSDVIKGIRRAVIEQAGVSQSEVHFGGKSINDHALNEYTNRSLWLGIPGAILAALVSFVCIRDWKLTGGMVFVAGLAGLTSLASVHLFGVMVNGLLVLMPVLVFVLTLGCAVHMVQTLQRTRDSQEIEPAIVEALRQSRPPVILSMVTTAIGISTLGFSPIPAVFQFGVFSAGSLLFGLLLLLFLLPATWRCWSFSVQSPVAIGSEGFLTRRLLRLNGKPQLAILMSALLAAPAIFGISNFETDLNSHTLFAPSTQFAIDYKWMQQNLNPMGRVDLVVGFPKSKQINRFNQLLQIRQLSALLRDDPHYHSALSVANLVRIPHSNSPMQKHITEQIIATQIDHDYDQLNREGLLYSDEQHDYWRLSVGCRTDAKNDELAISDKMLALTTASLKENPDQIQIQATGIGALSASSTRRLFADLVRGLVTAVIVITPIVMFSLRNFWLGLLAMVPNVFPILIVFGYCGLVGKKLDIGAILTASVGLGIAIDDTVHFLHYYRRGLKRETEDGKAIQNAIQFAIRRCARPIITTTLIVLCGLAMFSFSVFLPVRHFAICLILMMVAAAIADLVLLPALMRIRLLSSAIAV